jgi:hypothetical protein
MMNRDEGRDAPGTASALGPTADQRPDVRTALGKDGPATLPDETRMTQRTITFDDDEWQLVPRKPTPAMIGKALSSTATWRTFSGSAMTVNYKKMALRYRAMLCVAPCPYDLTRSWDREFETALAERDLVRLLGFSEEAKKAALLPTEDE